MITDDLIDEPPYILSAANKRHKFLCAMSQAFEWHYNRCNLYKKFIKSQKLVSLQFNSIEEIPFLPIQIFKEIILSSVPRSKEVTSILSSGTTSGNKSVIILDDVTRKRQQKVLYKIMTDFIGKDKRHFLIIDTKENSKRSGTQTSSRASAIRGLILLAKSTTFLLDEDLNFDSQVFESVIKTIKPGEKVCIMGFTWVIYQWFLAFSLKRPDFKEIKTEVIVLHVGGWKKLKEMNVSKAKFDDDIANFLGISSTKIIDIYGMTEQLGTVYPDCEFGFKHVPAYSEIIIRGLKSFLPLPIGVPGLIQLLSPLPNSYPGISILTEDVGKIIGADSCKCGRKGKYFVFLGRLKKAPIKGCGDVI